MGVAERFLQPPDLPLPLRELVLCLVLLPVLELAIIDPSKQLVPLLLERSCAGRACVCG